MNEDIVKGKWKEIKGKVKQKWGKFTDDDVTQIQGSFDQLSGSLQKKYGYQKDKAEEEINTFLEENHFLDKDR